MNEIMNIRGVECYEENGTAFLKLEDVAWGLGFSKAEEKNGKEYATIRWNRVFGFLNDIGFDHKWAKDGFIPENIFYRLAMKAKNEVAEKFQAFVCDEVLPAIRRTGVYAAPTVDAAFMRRLADEMEKKEKMIATQQKALEEMAPRIQYLDTILESPGMIATSQIAADYGLSANKLNKILHDEGLQRNVNGQWILYAKYMGQGLAKSRTFHFNHADGTPDTKMTTMWTQKGRVVIHNILAERGIVPEMDREVTRG